MERMVEHGGRQRERGSMALGHWGNRSAGNQIDKTSGRWGVAVKNKGATTKQTTITITENKRSKKDRNTKEINQEKAIDTIHIHKSEIASNRREGCLMDYK